MKKFIFGIMAISVLLVSTSGFASYDDWRKWKVKKDNCVNMQNSCKHNCPWLSETYCAREETICNNICDANGQNCYQQCYNVCVDWRTYQYQDPSCLYNCQYVCEIPETPPFGKQCECAADCSKSQDICSAGYCVDINDRFGDEYMN